MPTFNSSSASIDAVAIALYPPVASSSVISIRLQPLVAMVRSCRGRNPGVRMARGSSARCSRMSTDSSGA